MRESAGRGIGVSSFCQKEELVSVHFAKKRNWCQFILPKETTKRGIGVSSFCQKKQ
jgi:hypothetical protein